ncbi:acetyl-CoA carboxylase biotin carboxyl carrier protein [Acetivibrio ethanolgignens]|uniref:Biotin carboxyl carrier protein of acetyl-CoA carboxylase n=1 Tax=Acetivibrio ethanolgignens TaxID=290052 RepID=A0A0V8QCR9_9FIRM|nr:acetyl-CoA carboxylase biotin carboxyl carrier protein [Acetivibrio ethanolgignens]KSV58381.1 acetyl-CoA carboxylase biotin carboxyl carrier protein subunit [Acetivibrio ethanolgignens]
MEIKEILELVEAVSASKLTGFRYEENGVRLSLKKQTTVTKAEALQPEMDTRVTVQAVSVRETTAEEKLISSPLVGTFYAAPAEDAEAFVKTGDVVKKGQVLAIVEAMKLMNEIESEYDGTVAEILVENGQMVEYGQPLFRIV